MTTLKVASATTASAARVHKKSDDNTREQACWPVSEWLAFITRVRRSYAREFLRPEDGLTSAYIKVLRYIINGRIQVGGHLPNGH